jgi:hypothetical protein
VKSNKPPDKTTFSVFNFVIISVLVSIFLCWIPLAPLFGFIGGALGAKLLQKSFFEKHQEKPTKKVESTYLALSSLLNGLLLGYTFTIEFVSALAKPTEDNWLHLEALDSLFRNSPSFHWQMFLISSLIAGISVFFGSQLIFKLNFGLKKPNDEKLLAELKASELNKYLD